ncbi:unnamed protein product, partial [Cylicostephanus goldi]
EELYRHGLVDKGIIGETFSKETAYNKAPSKETYKKRVIYDTAPSKETYSKDKAYDISNALYKESYPKGVVYDRVAAKGKYHGAVIYDDVADERNLYDTVADDKNIYDDVYDSKDVSIVRDDIITGFYFSSLHTSMASYLPAIHIDPDRIRIESAAICLRTRASVPTCAPCSFNLPIHSASDPDGEDSFVCHYGRSVAE